MVGLIRCYCGTFLSQIKSSTACSEGVWEASEIALMSCSEVGLFFLDHIQNVRTVDKYGSLSFVFFLSALKLATCTVAAGWTQRRALIFWDVWNDCEIYHWP